MPTMFDPNAPMDFGAQNAELAKQQALAAALRKNAQPQPEGSMMGRIYVAPHWSQHVASALGDFMATKAETEAETKKANIATAAGKARDAWLPQAMAAARGTSEQAGPIDPNNTGELDAQPADRMHVLQQAIKGSTIPGNEKVAQLYLNTADANIKGMEDKAFKKQEALSKRLEDHQRWSEQLQQRKEALDKEIALKRERGEAADDLKRQQLQITGMLAQGNQAIRSMMAGLAREKFDENEPAVQAKERQTIESNAQKADQRVRDVKAAIELIPKSTGSKTGTYLDKALGAAGMTTDGAKAAKELETLQGNLLANGFRYPGSTSTYEAQMYKGALGDLANTELPTETRLAGARNVLRMAEAEAKVHKKHAETFNSRIRPGRPTAAIPETSYDTAAPVAPNAAVPRGNGGAGGIGDASLPDGWSFK